MKVLVCGGRNFDDYDLLSRTLYEVCDKYGLYEPEYKMPRDIEIIAGKAKGADTLAIDWCVVHWVPFKEYPANWDKDGKAAGFIRNQRMLDEGKPDLVIAFPGGRGTADMVRRSKKAGIEVIEIQSNKS